MLISKEMKNMAESLFWKTYRYRIDEGKVLPYELPDPFTCFDGQKITTKEEWIQKRRPELKKFYEDNLYGVIPPPPDHIEFHLLRQKDDALEGTAVRKEIEIVCSMKDGRSFSFTMLLYLPKGATAPVPAFLMMNFYGNHAASDEPDVLISDKQIGFLCRTNMQTVEQRARLRGSDELADKGFKYGCRECIRRGYAVATIWYESLMPDNGDFFDLSIYNLFYVNQDYHSEKRNYGSFCAWAWGFSRGIDCLENEMGVDASKIAIVGHSRLGKTALWAGVCDERVALTISNNSGCCGAKLFHRDFGECLWLHAYGRPYWYTMGIQNYALDEAHLPVDQHELLGLIAPRLVYVASATDDLGADPKGEFLSAWYAGEIYKLYGLNGLDCSLDDWKPDCLFQDGSIGYHLRPGEHAFLPYDWDRYLNFADKHLR